MPVKQSKLFLLKITAKKKRHNKIISCTILCIINKILKGDAQSDAQGYYCTADTDEWKTDTPSHRLQGVALMFTSPQKNSWDENFCRGV